MEWLQKINQMARHRQHPRVMDLDNVQCLLNNQHVDPYSTHDKSAAVSVTVPIMQVRKQQFLCQYQAHCFALCMCCDFFACDCRMQCPDGCSCFHDSTWSANVIQCSLRQHTDIPPLIPMDATTLFLDGNNFTGTLISQAFIGRKRVQNLFLNNSMIAAVSNQTFNGLTELEVLHLEDNLIERIEGYEFENLTSLRELHLQGNRLVYIDKFAFVTLNSLEVLQLHDNLLVSFPISQLNSLQLLSSVSLSNNLFACQCQFVQEFHKFVETSSVRLHRMKNTGVGSVIYDISDVKCISADSSAGGEVRLPLSQNVTCSDALAVTFTTTNNTNKLIPIAVAVTAICIVVAVTSIIVFVFRTPLRVWLHSKYGVRLGCCCSAKISKAENRDRLYDAFVGYSSNDEDFVQQVLVPQLEIENPGHKLCLQHRDLPSNSSIADTFPGVSQLCAKHILIVSRGYLQSEWTQIKFALQDVKKKWRPVIVILEELSTLDLAAAPEFNLLLKTAVVLRWGETGFWNKLRYYLPDGRRQAYRRNINTGTTTLQVNASNGCTSSPASSGSAMITATSPKSLLGTPSRRNNNWSSYDNVPSNNSSTSTRSTATAAGHFMNNGQGHEKVQLVSNPMDLLNQSQGIDQWSDDSAYSWHDHTYQSIHGQSQRHQPIYHSLDTEPGNPAFDSSGGPLGSLDVMLPNGQMVAATLMRNNTGKIVPVVQVPNTPTAGPQVRSKPIQPASSSNTTSSTSTTSVSPPPPGSTTMDHVTFPKTIVYKNDIVPTSSRSPQPRQQFGNFISNSGFTNPNNRHHLIQHNSPSKRGGGGYLV